MRKLETSDVFSFCRCMKKLGLKDHFRTIAQEVNTPEEIWARGYELIWGLFDIATEKEGENALSEFLAGPFEMTAEEVAHLHIDKLFENLKQLAEENNLLTFFKSAAKLMK